MDDQSHDDPFNGSIQTEDAPERTPEPEQAAAPAEPEQAAAEPEEPKARRGRGNLELDVKEVADAYCSGDIILGDGEFLTPHRIRKLIASRQSVSEPSGGAVSNVLKRWAEIGVCSISEKPLAFLNYTDEARTIGIAALKGRAKDAAKAAAKDAA